MTPARRTISGVFDLEGPEARGWQDRRQFSVYDWETVDTVLRDAEVEVMRRALANIGPYLLVVSTEASPDDETLPTSGEDNAGPRPLRETIPTRAALNLAEPSERPPWNPDKLSERELQVIGLLAAGRTNGEIAETLAISPRTVEHHVTNILNKTAVANRAEAAAYAVRHGLAEQS